MAVAKGLAGGYIPLGATLLRREIGARILASHGAFMTGHTYSGHTAACAAALAVQRLIERDGLIGRVRERGPRLLATLRERLEPLAAVGDVRGRGYLIGIELVRDRATKTPFEPQRAVAQAVARHAFEHGLIVYPCSGNAGEGRGDALIVAPPYNASDAELEELVDKLSASLAATLAPSPRRG